ncbi:MAG: hypothetical protein M1829_000982 [Trizodia sp. TS-e1964]|nr:MAG: hypothetical protein M1829_000982 [Trizodia sp. TS-e1964]
MDRLSAAASHSNSPNIESSGGAHRVYTRVGSRPLSDIRETTEPNLQLLLQKDHGVVYRGVTTAKSHLSKPPFIGARSSSNRLRKRDSSLSVSSIPPPCETDVMPSKAQNTALPMGKVGDAEMAVSPVLQKAGAKTFVRSILPRDILTFPSLHHARVAIDLRLPSPLFFGGGYLEGKIQIEVDRGLALNLRKGKDISLGRIAVDILGVEEVSDDKRSIFLSLATEIVNDDLPPPSAMLASPHERLSTGKFWTLVPSTCVLPFNISLPLNVGPGPFRSKRAMIRYMLCVTVLFAVGERRHSVRRTQDISLVSLLDPEKALLSLPTPLTATDEYISAPAHRPEKISITAGMHRKTWVSGTSLWIDIFVANYSSKGMKRMEVQLQRHVLFYTHTSATMLDPTASQERIPYGNEMKVISKIISRATAHGTWRGVPPYTSESMSCEVSIPRGHLSIRPGRYFEVRYQVNVVIGSTFSRLVSVQLPVKIVHMNSLDSVPNSLQQAMQGVPVPYQGVVDSVPLNQLQRNPGRAFSAARKPSAATLDVMSPKNISELTKALDESPRRSSRKVRSFDDSQSRNRDKLGRSIATADLRLRPTLSLNQNGVRCHPVPKKPAPQLGTDPKRGSGSSSVGLEDNDYWENRMLSHLDLSYPRIPPFRRELSLARKSSDALGEEWWRGIPLILDGMTKVT